MYIGFSISDTYVGEGKTLARLHAFPFAYRIRILIFMVYSIVTHLLENSSERLIHIAQRFISVRPLRVCV